jgi:hypothetical protein
MTTIDRRPSSVTTRPGRASTQSSLLRLAVAGAGTAIAVTAALTAQPAASATSDHGSPAAQHSRAGAGHSLAELKRSLRKYEDVSVAVAEGFVPVSGCTESPEGGMGVHYLHPARAMAPVDAAAPAVLLYQPMTDGGLRLLGAEWFQADADQDVSTDGDRPALWGRPFDGPMPGHDPMMPVHYDLHVWLYDSNPAGVFAPWNPSVSC